VRWPGMRLTLTRRGSRRAQLEETAEGLRFKPPKTRYGRRIISLPAMLVEILLVHRGVAARAADGARPRSVGRQRSGIRDAGWRALFRLTN